jgi:hypothetical protein
MAWGVLGGRLTGGTMPPLKNHPSQLQRGKAPDIVGTLRDWVGQDDRIAPSIVELEQSDSSSIIDQSTADEFQQAEPPPDRFEPDSVATPFENARKFDSAPPLQDLFEPDPYQPRSRAGLPGDSDFSESPTPVLAPGEPLHWQPRPSLASRLTRTVVYGMLALALVGIVFAVISNNGIEQRGDSVSPDMKIATTQPTPVDEANPILQQQLALQQQLEKLSNELATVRRVAEGLAARQEETAQNVANLQTSQQNIRDQVKALTALQSTSQFRRHPRRAAQR